MISRSAALSYSGLDSTHCHEVLYRTVPPRHPIERHNFICYVLETTIMNEERQGPSPVAN